MKPVILPSKLTVYALHFEEPVGRSLHYTGSTNSVLLLRRMREHQQGRGARLMTELHRRGLGFWLAKCEPIASRDEEKKRKAGGWAKRQCPICRTDPDERVYDELNGWFPPVAPVVEPKGQSFPVKPQRR